MKRETLIVALDVEDLQAVRRIVRTLSNSIQFYKVGLRLFTREGPRVVRWLKRKGFKVFLDLKFHDIPNTVSQAVESACRLGVDFITVHALGGEEMMRAALESARSSSKKWKKSPPKIFAVTILTSQNDLSPLGIPGSVKKGVFRLAGLARKAGVDGLVCSPQEVRELKKRYRKAFRFITPGIRLNSQGKDDQKRTATPEEALSFGADYLVVGRPILNASHPREVAEDILKSRA